MHLRPVRPRWIIALAATGIVAGGLAAAAPASAADPSSTTVTPAGDGFSSSLASGGSADFTVGSVTVSCSNSTDSGSVPAAPDNHNDAGAVSGPLAPPVFDNGGGAACSTNVVFTTATTTTSGDWTLSLQYDPAGSTVTLGIPQGGVVTATSGLASCTVTVAPDGPADVSGTWVPGDGTNPPQLVFSNAPVPITVTGGFGCPTSSTSADFSATYLTTDSTDSTQQITVGP
jgi:hypothetical protein